MKINNRQKMKLVVIFLLVVIMVAFTHCMPSNTIQVGNSGDEYDASHYTNPTPNNEPDEGQVLYQTQVTTGVKNHEQILHTMGEVTGIDPYSNTSIMNVYRQIEMSLPTDNDIKVYTTTQQVAVTKLAAEFCSALTSNSTLRQQTWPTLNYGTNPNTAFGSGKSTEFIDDTIDNFWGGMVTDEERQAAHNELEQLIDDLVGSDTNTTATQRTVRGVCTAALSSAHITLL